MDEEELRRIFDQITKNALTKDKDLCLTNLSAGLEHLPERDVRKYVSMWEEAVCKVLVKRGIWQGYMKLCDECEDEVRC